jgi:DNA-directed RNA polymerase subunit RPC12/RpoP
MFLSIMSEFKYACPVCGQHIKCDSSQAGTQMECPTCFQKIIVPQAPSDEQKFILTGSKVAGERPLPKAPDATTFAAPPSKTLPGVLVVIIIFLLIGSAVAFVYRGTIFKAKTPDSTNASAVAQSPVPPPKPSPPPKKPAPVMVAPPSNETNWTLNLKGRKIPDALAAGRIEGQDFVCQRATFQNGNLMLRNGDLGLQIFFGKATPDQLAGKSINVSTNTTAAARVVLRWQDGDQAMREAFTNQYAMLLNFGQLANNRMSGQIYLCTSDDKKSYVSGTFDTEIRKPKPKAQ